MIRHIVLFRFTETTTKEDIDAYERRLREYVSTLEGVLSYVIGRDAGINEGTYDFSIIGEFTDEDAFRTYFDSDDHREIQRDTAAMIAEKASLQTRFH